MDDTVRGKLLAEARGGDPRALGALLQSVGPYVRVVARGLRRGPGGPSESDLVQEVMLQAVRGFAAFRGASVAEFVGWVRQIAVRTAVRAAPAAPAALPADRLGDPAAALQARDTDPVQAAMQQELAVRMAEALTRLPAEMQEVLLGRLVDRLDHAQLAARLGRSPGAVRMLYLRAVRRLRQEYSDEPPGD